MHQSFNFKQQVQGVAVQEGSVLIIGDGKSFRVSWEAWNFNACQYAHYGKENFENLADAASFYAEKVAEMTRVLPLNCAECGEDCDASFPWDDGSAFFCEECEKKDQTQS